MRLVFLALILATDLLQISATMQNVTVTGTVICNKKRVPNLRVELWDKDTLDPNDLLNETKTDADGFFKIYGQEDEISKIEPFIRIAHGCAVSKKGCQRTADYPVPQSKIGGKYEMTYMVLDMMVHDEKQNC